MLVSLTLFGGRSLNPDPHFQSKRRIQRATTQLHVIIRSVQPHSTLVYRGRVAGISVLGLTGHQCYPILRLPVKLIPIKGEAVD
jgi:hypothetical protein